MAGQINWDMFMIMCFVIPFASIFTSDSTGVKAFMVETMQPILGGRSPIVFIILALIIATVLTNIANNMVVGAVFATLIFTIGGGMGLDVMPGHRGLGGLCQSGLGHSSCVSFGRHDVCQYPVVQDQ